MYKQKYLLSLYHIISMLCIAAMLSCGVKESTDPAQRIIDKAIRAHGSKIFDQSVIEFKFRDRNYKSTRSFGHFRYERFWDSTGTVIHDELTNNGLIRYMGNAKPILDAKKIDAYTASINSVLYFFALPFNLNDAPVIKEYLGEVTLLDQRYDKVKITFRPNANDKMIHDDIYVYWFNKKSNFIDYIGYSYKEPEETGIRFRQAINRREINGLTIQDYINFKPINDSVQTAVQDLDLAFAGNQLKELSRIINESVKVTLKK